MSFLQLGALLFLAMCLVFSTQSIIANGQSKELKTQVFLSPKFVMTPGSVINRYYNNIDFPKGHIGLKSFDVEVVDEAGISVPLDETYIHHWVVLRYYQNRNNHSDMIQARNRGVCPNLRQHFGFGSETRKTSNRVPDPYAIETGNPNDVPAGYEEKWMLNVHAIDTRGVVDKLGCTECRCGLYNVTLDEYGKPLKPGYEGGLYCCYDKTQCRLKQGFDGTPLLTASRGLYVKYTVKWFDWGSDSSLVPVQILIFDVTDEYGLDTDPKHNCRIEYDVEPCNSSGLADELCVHTQKTSFPVPLGGYVVYGVAHQHAGGLGLSLYGEDGRLICSSKPIYGKGHEAGNENGYVVGMSTCYPRPGSVKFTSGETLLLVSNYSSARKRTGVMGGFYVLITDYPAEPIMNHLEASSESYFAKLLDQLLNGPEKVKFATVAVFMVCAVILAVAIVAHHRRSGEGYSMVMSFD